MSLITDNELDRIISTPPATINDRFDSTDLMSYFQDHVWTSTETKALEKTPVTPSWKFMCPKRMRSIFDRALKASWCNSDHRALIEAAMVQL